MALDFSKFKFKVNLNFFSQLDARARVFVLFAGLLGVLFLVYLGTLWLSGDSSTVGPSKVASAPQSLQSVPGGQLTPEYYRALSQANVQAAEQAKITGSSAVPTLINAEGQGGGAPGQCNIICSDKSANVKSLLDDWIKQGKITPEVADQLAQFAKKNPMPDAYAAMLNDLVKQNKLTPEQARELLEQYKKQHANTLLQNSATTMDDMIKSGQLPLSVANELLTAQKAGESASDYANRLQQLVKEGKISAQTAQQLLAQYTQQRAKEITMQSIVILQEWAKQGQITPDVEKQLIDLETQMVSLGTFETEVKKFVTQGKLTPAVGDKIIDEYRQQKAAIGPTGSLNDMVARAEAPAFQELDDLLKAGKITQQTAQQLSDMIKANVTMDEFTAAVGKMVTANQLTPDIAKLKIADYQAVVAARATAAKLASLQQNNAKISDYAEALKNAVASGLLSADQAADLMRQYQAITSKPLAPIAPGSGTTDFAQLQKNLQKGASATGPVYDAAQFEGAQAQVVQETDQDRLARLQAMSTAMSGQAQQLVSAWQPPTMEHKAMVDSKKKTADGQSVDSGSSSATSNSSSSTSSTSAGGVPLIKAGTVLFAVLDTALNSDYPDTPVMVTIVQGPYKGAKLLGKLVTAKGPGGQLNRISLNFNLMNTDSWLQSKSVTAYAIDPDTARTVLASSVNNNMLTRWGAILATALMQGLGQATSSSGATTGIGLNGTQTTANPVYSTSNKMLIALGQIGQTVGGMVQNYVNIPPTVRVDSGVSLGILFMADVT